MRYDPVVSFDVPREYPGQKREFYFVNSPFIGFSVRKTGRQLEVLEMEGTEMAAGGIMSQAMIEFLILSIPTLGKLTVGELRTIERYMNLIEVTPGEIVFKEGERGDYVCFVVDGSLDVLKESETGKGVVISTLPKGSSIGEMAIIDDLPRSATVKARTKSTLLTLSRDNFDYILEEHSSIGVKVLKGIAGLLSMNLRKTSSKLADYMLPLG